MKNENSLLVRQRLFSFVISLGHLQIINSYCLESLKGDPLLI